MCTVQWVYSPSVLFSVCSVQNTGCNQESVMFMSCSESTLRMSSAPAKFLNCNILSGSPEDKIQCKFIYLFFNPRISQCTMTHILVHIYFRQVLTGGTYLSTLDSQQGILISAPTVSHCGSPVWKNGPCSERQCIGLLVEHCSNYIMSMLNLQIHLLWASSRQHECGIKQNKLCESVLPSVMLG